MGFNDLRFFVFYFFKTGLRSEPVQVWLSVYVSVIHMWEKEMLVKADNPLPNEKSQYRPVVHPHSCCCRSKGAGSHWAKPHLGMPEAFFFYAEL